MDKIEKNAVVTMHYRLSDESGKEIEANEMAYLHGHSNIIPGLEDNLTGLKPGDKKAVEVQPKDGYGEYRDDLIQVVERSAFPEGQQIEAGMQFQAQGEHGVQIFTVNEVKGDEISLDGNHPMAGKTLHFDIEVKEIRPATSEEVEHGHVHGPHDHHH